MITDVLSGAIIMGYAVAGVFFFRFWRRTHDSLFAIFGAAFWLLGLNHAIAALADIAREELSWVYLLRLGAFSLIILAIIMKNIGAKKLP
jgi:hypothetical protein